MMPELRERWHYLEYTPETGEIIHESEIEFRGQPPESYDDLRDRIRAKGRGFLALDPDADPLVDSARWRVQDGALTAYDPNPVQAWTDQYQAAQDVVAQLEASRPEGAELPVERVDEQPV